MTDVIVLCYHAVSPGWPSPWAVTPEQLEGDLRHLLERGYRAERFLDAVAQPRGRRTVAVTFDDAYRSVLEVARPVLAQLGVPGTVFVPTDPVDSGSEMRWGTLERWMGTPHEHELAPMGWDELALLAAEGWEIGSHTRSHPRLAALPDADLKNELSGSRERCEERLNIPCRTLAYPHGDADARVADAAGAAGYYAAGTIGRWSRRAPALCWPRLMRLRGDDDSRFRRRLSPGRRRVRASRVWALAGRS